MFHRFISKLRPSFTPRLSHRSGTLILKKKILSHSNFSRLSALAFGSFCTFSYLSHAQKAQALSEPTGFDSLEAIQEKCSSFGNKQQEAQTIEYLKKHLDIYSRLKGEKSDEVAIILMLLGSHCVALDDTKLDGLRYTEKSCDIFLEIESDKDLFLDQLDDIATMARQINVEESIRLQEKALSQKQKWKGEKSFGCVFNYLALGELFTIQDDKAKAASYFDKAKSLLDSHSGAADDDNDVYYEACDKFHTSNRIEDSNKFCKKALEQLRKKKGNDDAERIAKEERSLDIMAQNEIILGSPEKSLKHLDELEVLYEKTFDKKGDSYYLSKGQNFVKKGNIYFNTKDYKNSLANFQKALELFQNIKQQGGEVLVYVTLRTIADAYAALDEHKKAYEAMSKAYQVAKEAFGDNHPNTKNDAILLKELEKRGYN